MCFFYANSRDMRGNEGERDKKGPRLDSKQDTRIIIKICMFYMIC